MWLKKIRSGKDNSYLFEISHSLFSRKKKIFDIAKKRKKNQKEKEKK